MYIARIIEKTLKVAAKQFPSIIITGPRQSGKTTLLKHLFSKSHAYVSMDNPDLRLKATTEPEIFFQNYPPPLIIDEIQNAPQILSHIKMMIDKDRKKVGQFILTGSQLFPLMAKVSESLAGRIGVFALLPLSCKEQKDKKRLSTEADIRNRILYGGFPEVVTKKNINLEWWFASYLQTYLERDVRQLRQIGDLGDFQRFLQLLAAFNGQVLDLSSLSRDLGIAVNTIKAWISVLEASGQIVAIKPFYMNKGKRIIKSSKIYFLDTGLLCYLTGITTSEQVFKGPWAGQMLETLVLQELIKGFYDQGKIPRVFWWRTSHGEEVDFVVEDQGRIIPVEVKISARANTEMAKGLLSFSKLFKDKTDKAWLVYLGQEKTVISEKVMALPFGDFIKEV